MPRTLIQPTLESLAEADELAAQHDFVYEIVDFAMPHITPRESRERLSEYLTYEQPARLFSMHGAFIDLYLNSPDREIRRVATRRFRAQLAIAARLGLQYIVFHTNRLPMITHPGYVRGWVQAHVDFWNETLPLFPGVTVLLENMWDESPEPVLEVITRTLPGRLKLCFDTGHCNIFSRAPMTEWFDQAAPHLAYIHLNDNGGAIDDELAPGEGTVDWALFDRLARELPQAPHVVLEIGRRERLLAAIEYLTERRIYPF